MNTSTNVGPRQAITSLNAVDVLEITPHKKYVTFVLVKIVMQNQFENVVLQGLLIRLLLTCSVHLSVLIGNVEKCGL